MNRTLFIGFLAGLVFAGSILVGLLITDALTDQGGGEPRLPGLLGEPVEVIAGRVVSDDEAAPDPPAEPSTFTYQPVDGASGIGPPPAAGTPGPLADGPFGDSEVDSGDTTEVTAVDGPILAAIDLPGLPDGIFRPDLYFDLFDFGTFRFVDLCADESGLPGCPAGVGGTILAPLDGGLDALGDFRLGARLGQAPGDADCRATSDDGRSYHSEYPYVHPVHVWANHPATFDITWWPVDLPEARRDDRPTLSNAASDDPEFIRFADDATEGRLATSPWPRLCFELWEVTGWDEGTYLVEVEATSFTGASDSRTYVWEVPAGRRPPVGFEVLDEHDVRIHVPIAAEMGASITVIEADEPTTCADVESTRDHFGETLPDDDGSFIIDWGRQSSETAYSGTDTYDPAFDANQVVNVLDLREGTVYRVCVWWLEGGERSFDESVIVEREVHTIVTPSSLRPLIRLRTVENTTGGDLAADAIRLTSSCPGTDVLLPTNLLPDGAARSIPLEERPVLCDFDGRPAPDAVTVTATDGDSTRFAIPLSVLGDARSERVSISPEGLPTLTFDVVYLGSRGGGGNEWQIGGSRVFEPPPAEPEELPADIRVNSFGTSVEPDGPSGLRVNVAFDRPVRITASLVGDPCLSGGEPTYTSPAYSDRHTFSLDGLCLYTRYSVLVEAEAEDGTTGVFGDTTIPPYPEAAYAGLSGRTDGVHVGYTLTWSITDAPSPAVANPAYVQVFDVTVAGDRFDLGGRDRCFRAPVTGAGGTLFGGSGVWGDEVTVDIVLVVLEGGLGSCLAYDDRLVDTWRASLRHTLSDLSLIEGAWVVRIPFTATEVRGNEGPIDIEVVIRGRVTE